MIPRTTETAAIRHIERLLRPGPGIRVSAVHFLPGGYSNENFAFNIGTQKFVLRVPFVSQPYVDRQLEYAWYGSLPAGVAPELVAFDPATGQMITRWVEGQLLAQLSDQVSTGDLLAFVRQMHGILPDPGRNYDVAQLSWQFWEGEPPYMLPPSPEPELTPCHNDLNPWNILVTAAGWVVLDWEFAGNNDPLFDLIALHQGLDLPADGLMDFACAYTGMEPTVLATRLQQATHSFWLRELGWAHYQIRQGSTRREITGQLELASQRLDELSL